ncbi:MAG TPA: winged helix-turn-helix domain-containing protein [Acidimicrobiales bacterium]|nr:winged helix-turn-helix domain-containing protein [Acidimicrobiales bacterium]
MSTEVRIEHSYPDALAFLREYGPETVAVLHDLLAQAELRDGELVVRASVRQIAGRLGFISKDTVHRRLRQLVRAGVVRRAASTAAGDAAAPSYVIDLTETAISVSIARTPSRARTRNTRSTTSSSSPTLF